MMSALQPGRILNRATLLVMLHAALPADELRFARQATLAWLAAFPGDLEVGLLQARALLGGARAGSPESGRALAALELLARKDPFFSDAYRVLAQAAQGADPAQPLNPGAYGLAISSLYVLDGRVPERARLEPWAAPLRQAFLSLESKEYPAAEKRVQEALGCCPDLLLAAALHLLVDRATRDPQTLCRLAEIYRTRWPDCLVFSLALAEANLALGDEPESVRLLHQCAANDAAGQTACRLWGAQHPYRSLWSEDMVIPFDLPIPAGVAARLGWNHLAPGEIRPPLELPAKTENAADEEPGSPVELPAAAHTAPQTAAAEEVGAPEAEAPEAEMAPVGTETASADSESFAESAVVSMVSAAPAAAQDAAGEAKSPDAGGDFTHGAQKGTAQPEPSGAGRAAAIRQRRAKQPQRPADEVNQSVSGELERLAQRIKRPDLGRVDGRHPVYVIFTSREGLVAQYGPQTANILGAELHKLASLVRQQPGWSAAVYYPDDATSAAQFGLMPDNPQDPWKLKNLLTDLDGALGKKGQMIGALLIVGGDNVVPFHRLPNPTLDSDGEVFSDSPYATRDANYFVPEWPVGRLPGEKGPDAGHLLEQLRLMQRYHARRKMARGFLGLDWLAALKGLLERFLPAPSGPSFGYTAAVWQRSSLAVFRPIGAPHTVKSSPPEHSGTVDRGRIVSASLGYYNLHGLEDSPYWYGQRDSQGGSDVPDYPIALTPGDLRRNGHAPAVIFSEACYGAHVFNKCESDSLALKFLAMGTHAVVASTCVAYGAAGTPLIAGDLLGNLFWQHIKTGRTAGEALMQAKVDLVREMNRRQGFLDAEDQKTLISFVLYGDPLAGYDGFRVQSKGPARRKDHPMVKTVSDQAETTAPPAQLSGDTLIQVKELAAEYLPGVKMSGLDMAEIHYARQPIPVESKSREAAGSRKKSGAVGSTNAGGRYVVTVSKQVQAAQHLHRHYVRVTLDEGGTPVKVSISR